MPHDNILGLVSAHVLRELGEHPQKNVCPFRFPDRPTVRARFRGWLVDRLRTRLARRGFVLVRRPILAAAETGYRGLLEIAGGLQETYSLLADDLSRRTLVEVLAFRVLGSDHVKLSTNTQDYWDTLDYIGSHLSRGRSPIFSPLLKTNLQKFDLAPRGIPVALYSIPLGVYTMFLAEQYACRGERDAIEAKEGDVVIDGGGGWGDTALYFANRVGPSGRVFTFEFEPENLRILQQNLDLNPDLRGRVAVEQAALWDVPGESLAILANGPGTRVQATSTGAARVPTTTIDQLVRDQVTSRVDFIKLDIEGAELQALRGAEQTLRQFRPKLAVAIYHDLQDFVGIPAYLAGLGLGYRFYLRHFTIHAEETVLYAMAG